MSIGDVFAFFGALLAIGIALPGMLLAWSLVFPAAVERARLRLHYTPWKCLAFGVLLLAFSLPVTGALTGLHAGLAQMIGWLGIFLLLAFTSLGSAGLAALMGERLRGSGMAVAAPGALLRGAVALEMALIFPLVGWFVALPLVIVGSLGAAGFTVLRWMPRAPSRPTIVQATAPTIAPTIAPIPEIGHANHAS